jgi:drug/metabolite transporter (DMT)-like permease
VNPLLPVLALLFSSTLWGLTWLPLKHFGEHGFQGVVVTLGAHGAVGLCAYPLLLARRRHWLHAWPTMLWLTVLGALANLSFATAIVRGDVLRVMVLFYLVPAWGVLGGRFLLGEPINRSRQLSLVLALSGAFLVLGGPKLWQTPPGWVDLLAVCSGFTLAIHNVLFRKAQDVEIASKIGFSFVGCLVLSALLVGFGQVRMPDYIPQLIALQIVAFGLVWILLATVGTLWGVHHMEAGRSSILIIMELVTAVVSAALLSGRVPQPLEWFGGALILGSALVEGLRRPAQPSPAT